MLNSYVRYENGKTKKDYYHTYAIHIPIPMWNELRRIATSRHCPISMLVRSYIGEGLTKEKYYAN